MTRNTRIVTLFLIAMALPRVVRSQAGVEVRGVVKDETGAPIGEASVVLTDRDGKRVTTSSNWLGKYQLVASSPGPATLAIDSAGFASSIRRIVTPATGPLIVNVTLRVSANTRVDVHGGLTGVSLESGQNMSTITLSGSTLAVLPNDPESLLQTLRFLAGTAGTRADQVVFYIDGAPIDRRLPPKEVIQSIRINANPFSAEFSEPGASRVEIITKPASSRYHGDARLDFNDSKLNARNAFEPSRPPVQNRTFTGYAGGPIVRNRWGVLLYAGRWEQDENAVVDATTINPVTLAPQPFLLNVTTPSRTSSYSVKTDTLIAPGHIAAFEISRDQSNGQNAGLQSGFDLPERGYTSQGHEQTVSARLTSTISNRLLNEFRTQASGQFALDRALSAAPATVVLEGFSAGGNQLQLRDNTTNEFSISNVSTLPIGQHTVRFGLASERVQITQIDRSNYNGTFTFGNDVVRNKQGNPLLDANGQPTVLSALDVYRLTIAGVSGARPSQFSIVRGDPSVAFPLATRTAFVQDDWRLSQRMTVSFGTRTESQRELRTHFAFAPRAGIAWAPSDDGRSALRTGFGVFYTRIPQTLVSDVLRSVQGEELVVDRPAFFPAIPADLSSLTALRTTRTEAPEITTPRVILSTVSYDRQLGPHLYGSVGYTWKRGSDLLRTRVGGNAAGNVAQVLGPTLQFESTGRSTSHDVNVTTNGTIGSWMSVFSSYNWTRAYGDTDGPNTVPASSAALASEWGPAAVPRHQLGAGASFSLFEDILIIPFIRMSSSLPFNITTGRDNNGDTQFADRPALVLPDAPGAIVTQYGAFDPNPGPGAITIPRNSGRGPTEFTVDLTASWLVESLLAGTDRANLTITVNNLTNQINLAPYNGVLTSPFFGTANRALNPRRLTLTLRYDF